jgi:hypothetical protein
MSHFDKDYFDRLEKRRAGDPDYESPIRPPQPKPKPLTKYEQFLQAVGLILAIIGIAAIVIWIGSMSGLH